MVQKVSVPECSVVLFVIQYLLGPGVCVSAAGGHAVWGLDGLRLMILSMAPLLEMDSNMQQQQA